MFLRFVILALIIVCNACSSALYPGNVAMPQLKQKGEWALAGAGSMGAQGLGLQMQAAHAWSDKWGLQVSGQYLRPPSPAWNKIESHTAYEMGVLRLIKPKQSFAANTHYMLQAGVGYAASVKWLDDVDLIYDQRLLFVQGQSHHETPFDINVSFGLRVTATQFDWLQQPAVSPYYSAYRRYLYYPTVEYLEYRPLFWIVTPIFQLEYPLKRLVFTGSLQASHVVNQIDWRPPMRTLTVGMRWNIGG